MIHYNIARKMEINPFDGVKLVSLSPYSRGKEILQSFLDRKSDSVETRKVDGVWSIAYNIEHLDFTTLVEWIAPSRGKFHFKTEWVHFRIENDTMSCW